MTVLAVGTEDGTQAEQQQQHGQAERCSVDHLLVGCDPVRGAAARPPRQDRIGERQHKQREERADEDDHSMGSLALVLVVGVVVQWEEDRNEGEAGKESGDGGVPARRRRHIERGTVQPTRVHAAEPQSLEPDG